MDEEIIEETPLEEEFEEEFDEELEEEADGDDGADAEGADVEEAEAEEAEERSSYFPTRESLTEEELDEVADTAIDILRKILVFFDAEGAAIDEYEGDEGEIILDVVGEDLAVLIGRHGRTLDALQSLVSSITNRTLGFRYSVVVDVEGYRNRQRQKIEGLAHSAASRAVRQGNSVKLRPMTPYERRIVHIALRDDERVETQSEGREPNRQVVVSPV